MTGHKVKPPMLYAMAWHGALRDAVAQPGKPVLFATEDDEGRARNRLGVARAFLKSLIIYPLANPGLRTALLRGQTGFSRQQSGTGEWLIHITYHTGKTPSTLDLAAQALESTSQTNAKIG